jgi:hypothetical protein
MTKTWILPFLLFLLLAGCAPAPNELVLYDFEEDADLDRLHWRCRVLYSLSDEHVTRGAKSLRMELYPSEYPGLSPVLRQKDWGKYKVLALDLFNPMLREVSLTLRIDDREDNPEYADRCNETILLRPGQNNVVLPLERLKTSGTKRDLDWRRVALFVLFMVGPEEKTVLFVDNIRLEGYAKP